MELLIYYGGAIKATETTVARATICDFYGSVEYYIARRHEFWVGVLNLVPTYIFPTSQSYTLIGSQSTCLAFRVPTSHPPHLVENLRHSRMGDSPLTIALVYSHVNKKHHRCSGIVSIKGYYEVYGDGLQGWIIGCLLKYNGAFAC